MSDSAQMDDRTSVQSRNCASVRMHDRETVRLHRRAIARSGNLTMSLLLAVLLLGQTVGKGGAGQGTVDRGVRLADRTFRRFNQSMRLLADVQKATARVTVRGVARSNGVETVTATHAEIRP